jgi:hypothetical protein
MEVHGPTMAKISAPKPYVVYHSIRKLIFSLGLKPISHKIYGSLLRLDN